MVAFIAFNCVWWRDPVEHGGRWSVRGSRLGLTAAVAVVVLGSQLSFASPAGGGDLAGLQKQCDAQLRSYDAKIAHDRTLANVLLLLGAATAAVGSAAAGFVSHGTARKVSAIVGAVGAVLAIVPKTLPDPQELNQKKLTASQHAVLGRKCLVEVPFLPADDAAYRTQLEMFAAARLVDCATDPPTETVPDLPRRPSTAVSASVDQAALEMVAAHDRPPVANVDAAGKTGTLAASARPPRPPPPAARVVREARPVEKPVVVPPPPVPARP
jgi:hypothetical protein